MAQIKLDKNNYRIHTDKNKELIRKSLEDCGAGRSILIDKNDRIIAGNGIFEQAQALNIPMQIIESDGKKLIAVKRTDLDTYDDKRIQLAVMDNTTSDASEFDVDKLAQDLDKLSLIDFGLDEALLDFTDFNSFSDNNANETEETYNETKTDTDSVTAEYEDYNNDVENGIKRIVITYAEEDEPELIDLLGIEGEIKTVYDFSELKK